MTEPTGPSPERIADIRYQDVVYRGRHSAAASDVTDLLAAYDDLVAKLKTKENYTKCPTCGEKTIKPQSLSEAQLKLIKIGQMYGANND